jgi:CRP/FNR family transcriptional regulator, cyclic AMP receptor protein
MREHDPLRLVASIPLFASLEPADRGLVAGLLRVKRYAPRQTVVWEGQPGGALFLALSGFFKAVTSASTDGKEMLLSIMGPGEVFGELSVLDGQPRSASIVALQASELASIERESLLELLKTSPRLAVGLIEVLAQRLRNLTKRCETISSQDVPRRLAQVLITLANKHGKTDGRAVRIPVRLSQQDLGNMVGATRESVNKQLRQWTQTGILKHESGEVVILDLRALDA